MPEAPANTIWAAWKLHPQSALIADDRLEAEDDGEIKLSREVIAGALEGVLSDYT